MINRMAGLLAIMAFMVLTITWCIRVGLGLPAMRPSTVLTVGLAILVFYYMILGRIVAWLGIRLVQERVAERRAQEEEVLHQARLREQEMRQQRDVEEREENPAAAVAENRREGPAGGAPQSEEKPAAGAGEGTET